MKPVSLNKAKLKKIRVQFATVSSLILLMEDLLEDLKRKREKLNKESVKLLKAIEGE